MWRWVSGLQHCLPRVTSLMWTVPRTDGYPNTTIVSASCGTNIEKVPWLEQPPNPFRSIPTTKRFTNTTAGGSSRAEPDSAPPSGQPMCRVGTACPEPTR